MFHVQQQDFEDSGVLSFDDGITMLYGTYSVVRNQNVLVAIAIAQEKTMIIETVSISQGNSNMT